MTYYVLDDAMVVAGLDALDSATISPAEHLGITRINALRTSLREQIGGRLDGVAERLIAERAGRPGAMVRYTGTGEWSALYVAGKLDRVGDHYIIEERIAQLVGVEERQGDDFMCGGDDRKHVADTLDAVEECRQARDQAEATAAALRQQAADLIAQADKIEGKS